MNYLIANAGKQKAFCLKLSGSNVATNPVLDKLIVIIDPAILLPAAAFQAAPKDGSPKTIRFTNQSTYAEKYNWDFGDGSKSTEKSPEHTYAAAGTYEVTLTAEGIAGQTHSSTIKQTITVL
jgi:PKD repeat protein